MSVFRMAAIFFVTGKEKNGVEENRSLQRGQQEEESPYEFSLDPDTRAAEKRLRRIVAKQVLRCSCQSKAIESNGDITCYNI